MSRPYFAYDWLGLDFAGVLRSVIMRVTDLDWRAITDDFSEADLLYVRSVIDEQLRKLDTLHRKALIKKEK